MIDRILRVQGELSQMCQEVLSQTTGDLTIHCQTIIAETSQHQRTNRKIIEEVKRLAQQQGLENLTVLAQHNLVTRDWELPDSGPEMKAPLVQYNWTNWLT